MDTSSLPPPQQQQPQQLYPPFQEFQHQQLPEQSQQHQDYAPQPYDPSHYQAYNPWANYPYYHQDPQQSHQAYAHQHQHQQTQYPYYPQDYANANPQPMLPESGPIPSPRVPIPQATAAEGNSGVTLGPGQVQVQHQQNAYYPQGQNVGLAPGLNPAAAAAVAALSQLSQFAGTMGAAERALAGLQGQHLHGPGSELFHGGPGAMHPPVGHNPSYSGGGRRGGQPFQGGRGVALRGRGRGRGQGLRGGPARRFQSRGGSKYSQPMPSASVDVEATGGEEQPSSLNKPPPQRVWCELCRVDCTSMEILMQHKSGKKHKKNMEKADELKNDHNPMPNDPNLTVESMAVLPENVQQGTVPENLTTESNLDVKQGETLTENPSDSQPWKPKTGQFDGLRCGIKRKVWGARGGRGIRGGGRFGRGGKLMRPFEAAPWQQQAVELPPKPRVVIPLICDLCNVKCDTQEVLDCHLAGKKHMTKVKRFEDHQARFGPLGLQSLYPPNPIAHTLLLPQAHQQQPAVYGQQAAFQQPGVPYILPPQPVPVPGPNPQVSVGTVGLPDAQQLYVTAGSNANQPSVETRHEGVGIVPSSEVHVEAAR